MSTTFFVVTILTISSLLDYEKLFKNSDLKARRHFQTFKFSQQVYLNKSIV